MWETYVKNRGVEEWGGRIASIGTNKKFWCRKPSQKPIRRSGGGTAQIILGYEEEVRRKEYDEKWPLRGECADGRGGTICNRRCKIGMTEHIVGFYLGLNRFGFKTWGTSLFRRCNAGESRLQWWWTPGSSCCSKGTSTFVPVPSPDCQSHAYRCPIINSAFFFGAMFEPTINYLSLSRRP